MFLSEFIDMVCHYNVIIAYTTHGLCIPWPYAYIPPIQTPIISWDLGRQAHLLAAQAEVS